MPSIILGTRRRQLNRLGVRFKTISFFDVLLIEERMESMPQDIFHNVKIIHVRVVPEQRSRIEEDSIASFNLATVASLLHVACRMRKDDFIDRTTAILRNVSDFFNKE